MKSVMFVSAAFLAAGASAQNLNLSIRLSQDGGATWTSSIGDTLPGSVVQVGIWMSGDSSIYGMGGATLRLTGTSLVASDAAVFAAGTDTGRVGPFNFGAATNAIFRDSASSFRIDAASDAANSNSSAGLTFFQRDPATATPGTFSTANPALCFRFDLQIGADSSVRVIQLSLDQLSRGVASYFTAANASRPTTASATLSSATIGVNIPAPGGIAALGLAAIAVRRRRASVALV